MCGLFTISRRRVAVQLYTCTTSGSASGRLLSAFLAVSVRSALISTIANPFRSICSYQQKSIHKITPYCKRGSLPATYYDGEYTESLPHCTWLLLSSPHLFDCNESCGQCAENDDSEAVAPGPYNLLMIDRFFILSLCSPFYYGCL